MKLRLQGKLGDQCFQNRVAERRELQRKRVLDICTKYRLICINRNQIKEQWERRDCQRERGSLWGWICSLSWFWCTHIKALYIHTSLQFIVCSLFHINKTISQKSLSATPVSMCIPVVLRHSRVTQRVVKLGPDSLTPSFLISKLCLSIRSSLWLSGLIQNYSFTLYLCFEQQEECQTLLSNLQSLRKASPPHLPRGSLLLQVKNNKSILVLAPQEGQTVSKVLNKICTNIQYSRALKFLLDLWVLVLYTHSTLPLWAPKRLPIILFHKLCRNIYKILHW